MIYSGGKVWVLTGSYGKNDAKIEAYDPETMQKVVETKDFLAKYPVLSAGITEIRYDKKANSMAFKTRDGRDRLTYSFVDNNLYEDYSVFNNAMWKDSTYGSKVVLSNEPGSSQRKVLYKVTGARGKLKYHESSFDNYTPDKSGSKRYMDLDLERLTDKVYLEGIVYFQDEDCAIVIHLDQLGRKSERLVTCVDIKSGKEKWTANPDDLFKKMRIDLDKDSFSDLFFTKDKIEAKRLGDLVIIQLKGEGLLAFDYNTGKKLWEMSI
jgi:outer membrane protein assembly factor BamB